MRLKSLPVFFAVAAVLLLIWYRVEPWALTFVDDGPYYAGDYSGAIDELPVYSTVQLRRLGAVVFTLQSRLLPDSAGCALALWDASGHLKWVKIPVKPDGELGPFDLRRAELTWNGGWRVRIVPEFQESGNLYIGFFGGFRFFNHSW